MEKSPTEWYEFWDRELTQFAKRNKDYMKSGQMVVSRYWDGVKSDDDQTISQSLNFFHTNVATTQAMLYGNAPKIDVSREHADPDDDAARVAAVILERMLSVGVDPSGEGFATAAKCALQDRLLPGMGVARALYEVKTREEPQLDMGQPVLNEKGEPQMVEVFDSESANANYLHWKDFAWGWCRTWDECPWLAFRSYLDKSQVRSKWGDEWAEKLDYKAVSFKFDEDGLPIVSDDNKSTQKKAAIWQIWHKKTQCVFNVQLGQDQILDKTPDPLKLNGFWPIPMPMVANCVTEHFQPKADYLIYQDTYDQINTLYTRITNVTRAIKVLGTYDQSEEELANLLNDGRENEMLPVENWSQYSEAAGMSGKTDFFPVDRIAPVLGILQDSLDREITLLNRITGLSELMRGNSQQYAGVGQDQMAAKLGSVRIQSLQEDFARFVSDLMTLRAEIISKHFSPQSIMQQAGVQFLPQADHQYIEKAIALIKSENFLWRIKITPESIAMIDYQATKEERSAFIEGAALFLQSTGGIIKEMPQAMPIVLQMLKWTAAGYKGADYLEGMLDQAIDAAIKGAEQQKQNEQPSPEQLRAQAAQLQLQNTQAKTQGDLQKIQAKAQADMAALQARLQSKVAEIRADAERDSALEQQQADNRMSELMQEFANEMETIAANLNSAITIEETQAAADMANENLEHENTLIQIAAQRRTI